MFIKKEDFSYFEGLYKELDEVKRKKFLAALLKAGIKRSGENVSKIQVLSDEIFDERGVDPSEMITSTIIKKAYKTAKEE